MRIGALSVRARLTLWHAGVLTLVICVFAGGVLLFVRARLYRALDDQIRADLSIARRPAILESSPSAWEPASRSAKGPP